MSYVTLQTDVEIDVDEVLERLDDDQIASAVRRRLPRGITVERGLGDGDTSFARSVIARAESAARGMANLPREIQDLFWHVHGVAL